MVEPLTARAANFCAPAHEVKFTCLDLKAVEVDGSFEGYASLFHREDMSRDVVLPGAFSESLARRGPAGVKMLFQHDANQPIGVWATLKEDARGLYAQGRLMPEVAKAREVHALMRAGPAAGHVGFLVGETDGDVLLLGGNQSDAVTVAAFPKSRLLGLRWPQEALAERTPEPAVFEQALQHVLEIEGGFTDDVHDPGGPTNRGITLQVFADWRGVRLDAGSRAALKTELQSIDDQTVRAIYRKRYWKPAGCAAMPAALALFHFDAAVNHGVTGAIRLLQGAVGTDVDGEIGPLTRAAIARLAPEDILRRYADARRKRYRGLPHFWRFGRGWLNRVGATLKRAFDLAAVEPSNVSQQEGPRDMPTTPNPSPKWWGESVTIWGAVITALSTVLPALGPFIGIDITGELVREAGEHLVETVQAVGGLIGTAMTIYGRVRATAPLDRRNVTMKV